MQHGWVGAAISNPPLTSTWLGLGPAVRTVVGVTVVGVTVVGVTVVGVTVVGVTVVGVLS